MRFEEHGQASDTDINAVIGNAHCDNSRTITSCKFNIFLQKNQLSFMYWAELRRAETFRGRRRVSSTGRGLRAPIIGSARKTAKIARDDFFAVAVWHGSSLLP